MSAATALKPVRDRANGWRTDIPRAPLSRELSPVERSVAALAGAGYRPKAIADALGIGVASVRTHITNVARLIPGDLLPLARVSVWARGGDLAVLTNLRMTK